MSSSLPSGAISALNRAFGVDSDQQSTLPVAIFLVGDIFGPILFGPMSESYGRKICFISSFAIYTIFTMACALSKSWPSFLIFRCMVEIGASAPQALVGEMYSDIYVDLVPRGRTVMILGLTSNIGPLVGPIIAGYTSTYKWQWIFWINLIMTGLIWPLLVFLPGWYGDQVRLT